MSKKSKPKGSSVASQAKPPVPLASNAAPPPIGASAATPKNFYMRHDPFFTLLGTILIFITFIAKESVGEYFKESLTSIEKAEDMFIMRGKFADSLSNKRFIFLPEASLYMSANAIDTGEDYRKVICHRGPILSGNFANGNGLSSVTGVGGQPPPQCRIKSRCHQQLIRSSRPRGPSTARAVSVPLALHCMELAALEAICRKLTT